MKKTGQEIVKKNIKKVFNNFSRVSVSFFQKPMAAAVRLERMLESFFSLY